MYVLTHSALARGVRGCGAQPSRGGFWAPAPRSGASQAPSCCPSAPGWRSPPRTAAQRRQPRPHRIRVRVRVGRKRRQGATPTPTPTPVLLLLLLPAVCARCVRWWSGWPTTSSPPCCSGSASPPWCVAWHATAAATTTTTPPPPEHACLPRCLPAQPPGSSWRVRRAGPAPRATAGHHLRLAPGLRCPRGQPGAAGVGALAAHPARRPGRVAVRAAPQTRSPQPAACSQQPLSPPPP